MTDASPNRSSSLDPKPPSQLLDVVAKSIQILSVVTGVVVSVLSYTAALNKDSQTRAQETQRYHDQKQVEEEKRKFEAARPFIELRQERYTETVKVAAILANPDDHTPEELQTARKRFRQLYVTELTLVEGFNVEVNMRNLAVAMHDPIVEFDDVQSAAFELALALRDSLRKSWNIDASVVDNPVK